MTMKKHAIRFTQRLSRPTLVIVCSFFTLLTAYAGTEKQAQLSSTALYNILAGEFASHRGQYEHALDFYLPQARFYHSPYLAERATRLALNQKRYKDMLEAAKIWQQANNGEALAHFFLALALAHNKHIDEAFKHMLETAKLNHSTDFTWLVHQISEQQTQENVLHKLLVITDAYPANYDIHLAIAMLSLITGDNEQALIYTDKATDATIDNDAVYTYAADIYLNQNLPDKALEMYRKALDKTPHNVELRLRYALLASRYDLNLAAQEFQILFTLIPKHPLILLNLGLISLDQENYQKSKLMFERLLTQTEHKALAHYYLGQIASINNNDAQALQHFLAINKSPETASAREHIAAIYMKQMRYDEAEELIKSELQSAKNPDRIERLNILMATLLQQQGYPDKAYDYLSQQLSNSPDAIDVRYTRAMLAELQDNLLQMEDDLRHIIQIQPDSILALNALGYTLAKKTNRLDEAYDLIQQALQLSPQDPAILDSMGWVLYRMGQWQEALKYLQQAMQQFPDAEVAAHLGEVLWMIGQKEDARVVLKDALHQTPDHTELNETIRRLNIPL